MRVEVKTITPKLAAEWLEKNVPNNRNKKRANISQMKHDMQRDTFYITTDCIGFNSNGDLINGQNRLTACVESGCSFKQAVMFDIDPRAMIVMDSGAKRTTNDHFKISGRDYPSGAGSTVRRLLLGMRAHNRIVFSDTEVDEFLTTRRNREGVWFAHRVFGQIAFRYSSLRAVVARAHILNTLHKTGWDDLLDKFAYVINMNQVSGVYELSASALRTWMLDHARQSRGGEWAKVELYQMAESALWNFLHRYRRAELEPVTEEMFKLPGEDKWNAEPADIPPKRRVNHHGSRNGKVMQPA